MIPIELKVIVEGTLLGKIKMEIINQSTTEIKENNFLLPGNWFATPEYIKETLERKIQDDYKGNKVAVAYI